MRIEVLSGERKGIMGITDVHLFNSDAKKIVYNSFRGVTVVIPFLI